MTTTTNTQTHTHDAYEIIDHLEVIFHDHGLDHRSDSVSGMVLGLMAEQVYVFTQATKDLVRLSERMMKEASGVLIDIERNFAVAGLANSARTVADLVAAQEVRANASKTLVIMIARIAATTSDPEAFRTITAAAIFGTPTY